MIKPPEPAAVAAAGPAPASPEVPTSVADDWRANCFSKIFFNWMSPLVALGVSRPLEQADLGAVKDSTQPATHELKALLESTQAAAHGSLWPVYRRWRTKDMGIAIACKLVGDLLGFVPVIALPLLLQYIGEAWAGAQHSSSDITWAWLYGASMLIAPALQNILLQQHHALAINTGIAIRAALQGCIMDKAVNLSTAARTAVGTGPIQQLAQSDAVAAHMLYYFISYVPALPIQLTLIMVLLWQQLGPASLVSVAVTVAISPAQKALSRILASRGEAAAKCSDARMKLLNELITGMRAVKTNAWEPAFMSRIGADRDAELHEKRKLAMLTAGNTTLLSAGPMITALLSFVVYAAVSSDSLTPERAYTALALLNMLSLPFMIFPILVGSIAGANVASKRLSRFFRLPEFHSTAAVEQQPGLEPGQPHVRLQAASFRWDAPDTGLAPLTTDDEIDWSGEGGQPWDGLQVQSSTLRNMSLSIPAGQLTAVVGSVGAGKSTLLSALLGDVSLRRGTVTFASRNGAAPFMAYCAQDAWLPFAPVREAITFGLEMDHELYNTVVYACALQPDFNAMPAGDLTPVGQRGVTLSGGQRARVALARAVYAAMSIHKGRVPTGVDAQCAHAGPPIVLLDSVLSAVDAHVSAHLTKHVLRGCLQEVGATIVLATHSQHVLKHAQHILALHGGELLAEGSWAQLQHMAAQPAGELTEAQLAALEAALYRPGDASPAATRPPPADGEAAQPQPAAMPAAAAHVSHASEHDSEEGEMEQAAGGRPPPAATAGASQKQPATDNGSAGMQAESRETGAVATKVYAQYLQSVGKSLTVMLVVLAAAAASKVLSSWWLSEWSDNVYDHGALWYAGMYAVFIVGSVLLQAMYQLLWAHEGIVAAASMHAKLLHAMVRTPLAFFDVNPTGRITNRFSGDMEIIDRQLPVSFSGAISLCFAIAGTLLLQMLVLPWSIVAVLPVTAIYVRLQYLYRASGREIKRLESIARSPQFALLDEVLAGLTTVRAFQGVPRSQAENIKLSDAYTVAFFKINSLNRWLGVRLDLIGAALTGTAALAAVGTAGSVSAGLVGLVLSQSLQTTGLLNWLVRTMSQLEAQMASVERVLEYSSLPEEGAEYAHGVDLEHWPSRGDIEWQHLSMAYRKELGLVLRDVNVHIPAGKRVGICGRTGSGKSSLLQVLLRLVEPREGRVVIDGVDTSTVGVRQLREAIAIVQQDAPLFSMSLRQNLDPPGTCSDERLWAVLKLIRMDEAVRALPQGLSTEVTSGGSNFSAGERQLLCLARAVLRGSRIVALDEASGSLDAATDAAIQRMLANEFADTTMLIIAHRLDTIAYCDYVLVMEDGRVAEWGVPAELEADPASAWAQLRAAAAAAERHEAH